jgi:hypothetical protein
MPTRHEQPPPFSRDAESAERSAGGVNEFDLATTAARSAAADLRVAANGRALLVAAAMGAAMTLFGVAVRAHGAANANASCRIHNQLPSGVANVGSGTLVDVTADRRRGLVLTCAHLFAEGTGRIVVEFTDRRTHGAKLIAVDRHADLAAVEIANPQRVAAPIAFGVDGPGALTACGFGPTGQFRAIAGPIVGSAEGPGQSSLKIAGAVRSGDSGGGVFDSQGRLVAVVWGECEGVTYASSGGPLRRFVERLLSRRARAPSYCPDGTCPLEAPGRLGGAPAGRWPAADNGELWSGGGAGQGDARQGCNCGDELAAIAGRLDALDQAEADASDRRDSLAPLANVAGRAAAPFVLSALGIAGPMGWGALAAIGLGGWLLGRRLRRRRHHQPSSIENPASSIRATPEATADAAPSFRRSRLSVETHRPVERDDREARQLLRLSQLEGRDPLQDALAGRLALDRLDATADGDADPQRARWADELRRELRDRFNEVAPTKFQVRA